MISKARADLVGTAGGQAIALFLLLADFGVAFWGSTLPPGSWFWQWDKAVHMIAGGLVAFLFYPYFLRARSLLFLVFFIGVALEVAEFWASVTLAEYDGSLWYATDVALDLVADVAGAWIMIWLIKRFRHE